jgi:ElaB/YqjD/DUF883 family membrane-anchored ribosome-binding protein
MSQTTTRKLMDDLKTVVADAEALMAATASDASERARDARKRATESVGHARARLDALEAQLKARATEAADQADRYVHDNPWQVIAVAAGVGALVGILLGRR